MIDILTIVRETDENGIPAYTVNGGLPLDEAAKALVIIAFNANKPEKEEKGSDVVQGDSP